MPSRAVQYSKPKSDSFCLTECTAGETQETHLRAMSWRKKKRTTEREKERNRERERATETQTEGRERGSERGRERSEELERGRERSEHGRGYERRNVGRRVAEVGGLQG